MIARYLYLSADTPKAEKKEEINLPYQQVAFCLILGNATSTYNDQFRQLKAAQEQNNGIISQQLTADLTSVYRFRNKDIFRLVELTTFAFAEWLVTLESILSFTAGESKLRFTYIRSGRQ
jgi:hypothetical protein